MTEGVGWFLAKAAFAAVVATFSLARDGPVWLFVITFVGAYIVASCFHLAIKLIIEVRKQFIRRSLERKP